MFSEKGLLLIWILFCSGLLFAQDCTFTIEGVVMDENTAEPLSFVNVYVQELEIGAITDDNGVFAIGKICAGTYHLVVSHIGCAPKEIHVDLESDTLLNIILDHTTISLDDIVVEDKKSNYNNQPGLSVNRQTIEDNVNRNLAALLVNESGVYLLKNGSGIAKPIVNGMYGNRLTILNNGVAQSGQQWGNDHSPEIDPLSADVVTVLKGANALEYGGGNLGSMILVVPKKIGREPHLHGHVNYAFETNGQGHSVNTRLQKYTSLFAWRANATLKKYGDRNTADYFLKNTGNEEINFSFQLEKSWKEKLFFNFYASTFNATLGILRGSHIGNLSDLEDARFREEPFFTEPDFSYSIASPRQKVSHHLTKLDAKYYFDESQSLEVVIAGQQNNRKEFDVRRNGRSNIPALSLRQYTLNADIKYTKGLDKNWKFTVGNQNVLTDNTNIPETDILPLIPDFRSWRSGFFSTFSRQKNKFNFNFGLRYDYEYQNVLYIGRNIPREVIQYENEFNNLGAVMGLTYELSTSQSLTLHTGYATRNPAVNERYSSGLHQGVSGIEEGDISLQTERAFKNSLEYKWLKSARFSFTALLYHQAFQDYIFLQAEDELRTTIRGVFPVFTYRQTDASISGFDVSSQFMVGKSFYGLLKYSYLKGNDIINNIPLVFMPPNSAFASLIYRVDKFVELSQKIKLKQLEFELNTRYVFEQTNLLAEQEFFNLPAPASYNLIGLGISTNIILPNYKFRFTAKVDNLLNTRYRDYLNRQRYFADDTGRSIVFGINLKF